jgi:hypothetical protein
VHPGDRHALLPGAVGRPDAVSWQRSRELGIRHRARWGAALRLFGLDFFDLLCLSDWFCDEFLDLFHSICFSS